MTSSTAASAPSHPVLMLDPEEVAAFIAQRKTYVQSFRERFRDDDIHEIAYEDISRDSRLCAAAIADLMGWSPPEEPLELPIRKQNTRAVRDTVSNYGDIADYDKPHL
ncbi:MAG: hypothetical protein QNJ35_12945 [Paracoccaceae bacterium]|nr:hypothetical protein [Paracoccaceae bacterium]